MKSAQNWQPLMESLRILHSQDTSSLTQFTVSPNLSSFEGHFPSNPVLAAASMLEFSLFVARELKTFSSEPLKKIKSAKFLEPLRPDHEVQIEFLHEKNDEKNMTVTWRIFSQENQAWIKGAEFDFSTTSSLTIL